MSDSEQRYLIIAGAPKCGTTSLYKWLSDHPDISPSTLKETRFFLDHDYPLPSLKRYDGTNLYKYSGFFSEGGDAVRLEATPDYLYSARALQIAKVLPNAKLLFIVRDPVVRMVSWYKYARQRGFLEEKISFEQYVRQQIGQTVSRSTPIHLRALDQCRYDYYLDRFRAVLGDRMLVVSFDELAKNPYLFISRICDWYDLDSEFYINYVFHRENVTRNTTYPKIYAIYISIRRRTRYFFHSFPSLIKLLRLPNRVIKKILATSSKPSTDVNVSDELSRLILKHCSYRSSVQKEREYAKTN